MTSHIDHRQTTEQSHEQRQYQQIQLVSCSRWVGWRSTSGTYVWYRFLQQLGSDALCPVTDPWILISTLAGTWTYEPPRLQPHSRSVARSPTHIHAAVQDFSSPRSQHSISLTHFTVLSGHFTHSLAAPAWSLLTITYTLAHPYLLQWLVQEKQRPSTHCLGPAAGSQMLICTHAPTALAGETARKEATSGVPCPDLDFPTQMICRHVRASSVKDHGDD